MILLKNSFGYILNLLVFVFILMLIEKCIYCILTIYISKKNPKYKYKPKAIIEDIKVIGFNKIELVLFDYGLIRQVECTFSDLTF